MTAEGIRPPDAGIPPEGAEPAQEVILTVRLTVRRVLSRTEVIRAVERLQSSRWTIRDVTKAMQEQDYRVKAAVGWLIHHGRVVRVGERVMHSSTGRKYTVDTYRLIKEKSPADITGLYKAFGLKG
jgi:hypothetical protein